MLSTGVVEVRVHRLAALAALIVGLGAAPASAAPVLSSHSGWFWGSPAPQAQTLSAVEFAGNVGFASGDFGTLMRSDDGGRNWAGLKTGLTEPLTHLHMLGSKTVVVAGTCAVRRSDDSGATFRRLPWTASDESCSGGVAAIDFPTSSVGYLILRNGNVVRSGDSGRTWSRRTAIPDTSVSGVPGISPVDVDFVTDSTGFVVTSGGEAFQTTDGGNTWRTVLGLPFSLRSVDFPSPGLGYVAGEAPAVFKTSDGGASWQESDLPADIAALSQIRCATPDICEGVSTFGDRLVRTTDGGGTWDSVSPTTAPLKAVALPTPDQVVGVGADGTTVVSTPGAGSFVPIGGALPGQFNAVSAVTGATAFAFGRGGSLARTTNGGISWTETDAATSDDIRDISFLTADRGYVLDTSGQLLLTTNGGGSYEILDTGTADRPLAVQAVSSKQVLLVGPAGVWRSTDGRTFRVNAQSDVRKAPLFDADRSGKTVVAYGPSHVFLSRNGGATFRRISRPSTKTRVDVIDLVGPRSAYLLDARGYLFRTDSAGRRWRELPGLGTEIGYGMSFSDSKHGWVAVPEFGAGRDGWLMRTNDGGRTWEPQLLARSSITRFGVAAAGKAGGFAVSGSNGVFGTRTSGSAGRASKLTISSPVRRIPKLKPVKVKTRRGNRLRTPSGFNVRLHGRLSRARGGERVVVSYRENPSADWLFQEVAVASSGSFTVVARVKYGTTFVAQWAGDDRLRGAGSRALRIPGPPVPKPKKRSR
ncbi:MAG TPA: YCF48-related protein [Thermoleophilaceae bacterium]